MISNLISKAKRRVWSFDALPGKLDDVATQLRHLNQRMDILTEPRSSGGLFRALQARSQERTMDIIEDEMADAIHFHEHRTLLKHALSKAGDGTVLEFGVFSGTTINWMATDFPERSFVGFDTFDGLPEEWSGYAHFDFDRKGAIPDVPRNVEIVKGLFESTAPAFAKRGQKIAAIHIDCDLYSSTKTIFDALGDTLPDGCVLIFDEYFNYPGFERHERKAFAEFLSFTGRSAKWIGFRGEQAACILGGKPVADVTAQ
jgi:predicted O-methyltransferase YrrM